MLLCHHSLGGDIFFLELLFLLIFFVDYKTLLFQMLHDKIYTIVCVVWEQDTKNPRLLVIHFPPAYGKEVGVIQIPLDVINCWESAPTNQFADTLHLGLWLQDKENTLRNNNIDVNNCPLFDFVYHVLLLLTARINGNPRILCPAVLHGEL